MIWIIFKKTLKNATEKKKRKILIVFDDMIANMLSNKKINPIVTEPFILPLINNSVTIGLSSLLN